VSCLVIILGLGGGHVGCLRNLSLSVSLLTINYMLLTFPFQYITLLTSVDLNVISV